MGKRVPRAARERAVATKGKTLPLSVNCNKLALLSRHVQRVKGGVVHQGGVGDGPHE